MNLLKESKFFDQFNMKIDEHNSLLTTPEEYQRGLLKEVNQEFSKRLEDLSLFKY